MALTKTNDAQILPGNSFEYPITPFSILAGEERNGVHSSALTYQLWTRDLAGFIGETDVFLAQATQ